MTALKEFRVKLTVRNNLLVARREALGMKAREVAEAAGIGYQTLLDLESLRQSALLSSSGGWSRPAKKIAEFFKVLPEDLFPGAILAAKQISAEREMGAEEAFALSGCEQSMPDQVLLLDERKRLVLGAVSSNLSDREQEVIALRFGIGGGEPLSYDEIGDAQGCSRERIRQIELKALRKLRHPSRSKALAEVLP